jgi:hypothetical protein
MKTTPQIVIWRALVDSAILRFLEREFPGQRLTTSVRVDAIESTRHSSQRQPPLPVSSINAM